MTKQLILMLSRFKDDGVIPMALLVPFKMMDFIMDIPVTEIPELMGAVLIGRRGHEAIVIRIPHEEEKVSL